MKNNPPKAPKNQEPLSGKDEFDKKFRVEKNFKGKFRGSRFRFVFKKGDDELVGYYPDNPSTPVKHIIRICINSLLDSISMLS